jgi:hypothetical protein
MEASRPRPPSVLPIAGAAGLVLVAVVVLGFRYGVAVSFLALSALALLGVVWLLYRSIQTLVEPGDQDAEALFAPTFAEDRKRAALKALKDLDYEKSIGNVTDEDYKQLLGRYREEAKRAMRILDDERADRRAEADGLAKRAVAKALGGEADEMPETRQEPSAKGSKRRKRSETPAEAPISRRERAKLAGEPARCAKCETANDEDAQFCKKCGAKLLVSEEEK